MGAGGLMATFLIYLCFKYQKPNLLGVAVPLGYLIDFVVVYAIMDALGYGL